MITCIEGGIGVVTDELVLEEEDEEDEVVIEVRDRTIVSELEGRLGSQEGLLTPLRPDMSSAHLLIGTVVNTALVVSIPLNESIDPGTDGEGLKVWYLVVALENACGKA